MKGFKTRAGVTWDDVREALQAFEEDNRCRVEITVAPRVAHGSGKGFLRLKVCAVGGELSAGLCWRREYSLDWPSYGSRTMAGAFLRVLHEAQESLVERPPKPGKAWKTIAPPLG